MGRSRPTAERAPATRLRRVKTVVVGFDGSGPARAALEFAAEEAVLRDARLRIVCAWEIPSSIYAGGYAPGFDASTFDGFREAAEALAAEAVEAAKRLQPGLDCEGHAAGGQPAEVLLREARDAALIAVGNRGRGGFKSLLLGSVSQQVVHHASCPVTVVREGGDAGREPGSV
jgi:nucleotide-binding universal stress UspA family protein